MIILFGTDLLSSVIIGNGPRNLTKIFTYLDSIVSGIATLAVKLAEEGYFNIIFVSNIPPAQVSEIKR